MVMVIIGLIVANKQSTGHGDNKFDSRRQAKTAGHGDSTFDSIRQSSGRSW